MNSNYLSKCHDVQQFHKVL